MEVLVVVAVILVALYLAVAFAVGAWALAQFAALQGFVGLAAYAAAWVFLMPVMAIASVIVGIGVLHGRRSEPPGR